MSKDTIEIPDFDFDFEGGIVDDPPAGPEAIDAPEGTDPKDAIDESPVDPPPTDPKLEDIDSPTDLPKEDDGGETPDVGVTEATAKARADADAGPLNDDDEKENTVVNEIITTLGYEVEEEFEDTPEGIANLTKHVGDRMANEKLDAIFERHPTIKAHFQHVQNGGDVDRFFQVYGQEVDYGRLEIKDDDDAAQKAILTEYFRQRGEDPTIANDMIETYEDKGHLANRATAARTALTRAQEGRRQALREEQEAIVAQQQRDIEKTWEDVREIVNDNETLSGIPVSRKERTKFLDYVTKPITKEGYTQRDFDHSEASLEQQLAIDFLMFKNLDMSKFIATKARTTVTKNLRSRLKDKDKVGKDGAGRTSSDTKELVDEIEFDFEEMGS